MAAVTIEYGKESRSRILAGAAKLNKAVSATLGPAGRWVLFRHMGTVFSTKDGVTVAREINLPDPYESIGADLIKNAAGQAVDEAGDGTTTATLLAHSIFAAGCDAIDAGHEPVRLARGIQRAVTAVVGELEPKTRKFHGGILEQFSVPCSPELAFQAAKISANGDEAIAKVVSDAVLKVGVEGALTIGDSFSQDHLLEVAEGMQVSSGFAHPYLINDVQRNRCVFEQVTVCLINRRVSTANEATGILSAAVKCAQGRQRAVAILLICDDIDPEALNHIVFNATKPNSRIPITVVRAPLWGDARRALFEDLALITKAERIETAKGKDYAELHASNFGLAERIVVNASKTIITAPAYDEHYRSKKVEPYLEGLKSLIADEALRPDERDAAKQRLAALTGGVAVIKVGGTSADAVKQIKFQVEDAIHATRAAVADGVVPGGGSALLFAQEMLEDSEDDLTAAEEDERTGFNLLLKCLDMPLRIIAENAGHDETDVVSNVRANGIGHDKNGFDAATGKYVEDMIAAGIVDPLRVVRCSLNAAASAACVMLKTECVIGHDAANTPAQPYPGRN